MENTEEKTGFPLALDFTRKDEGLLGVLGFDKERGDAIQTLVFSIFEKNTINLSDIKEEDKNRVDGEGDKAFDLSLGLQDLAAELSNPNEFTFAVFVLGRHIERVSAPNPLEALFGGMFGGGRRGSKREEPKKEEA